MPPAAPPSPVPDAPAPRAERPRVPPGGRPGSRGEAMTGAAGRALPFAAACGPAKFSGDRRHASGSAAVTGADRPGTGPDIGCLDGENDRPAGLASQGAAEPERVGQAEAVRAAGAASRAAARGPGWASSPAGATRWIRPGRGARPAGPPWSASTITARPAPDHASISPDGSPSENTTRTPGRCWRSIAAATAGPIPSSRRKGFPIPMTTLITLAAAPPRAPSRGLPAPRWRRCRSSGENR